MQASTINRHGWRRVVPWLAVSALYVALTLVYTWPLVTRLPDVLPHDLGDPVLNAWILWWNTHAVPLSTSWWNAPIFWPSTGALGFSETLLGLAPLTNAIQWFGGSPITAHNVAFLITFPLSALAAHALTYRLTGRHDAAIVSGLVYGFNPVRAAHLPHVQVLTSYWMPVALLGLHEYMASRQTRWLWVFGLAWLMQALSNGYFLLFFPVLIGLWIGWHALTRANHRPLAAIAAASVVASLPLVPLLWGYQKIHDAFGMHRGLEEIGIFSADVTSFLDASPLLKFWTLTSFERPEGQLFPGLVAILLVLLLVSMGIAHASRQRRAPRACLPLLVLALLFIGVASSTILAGPWSLTIGRTTLLTATVVYKPLSIGILLFAIAFVLHMTSGGQRLTPAMFYVLAAAVMYLLCLGPEPRFLGAQFLYKPPYAWLMQLPGYPSVRSPARFAMLAVLCMSVGAGFGFARLTARAGRTARVALALVICGGILADGWIRELPLPPLQERLHALESLPPGTSVLELPLGGAFDDIQAIYRGMYHGRSVVNGYSGFFPPSYFVLRRGFALHDPDMFDVLAAGGPLAIAVNAARDQDGLWKKHLASRPHTRLLGDEAGRTFFALSGGSLPPDISQSERLPVRSISANINDDLTRRMQDGDLATWWTGGPQRGTEVVTIDLGATEPVDGVTMTLGESASDFPRLLLVETSEEGSTWTMRWQGSGAGRALAGALRDPRSVPIQIALSDAPVRLIRLRQLGRDPFYAWTIAELTVWGRHPH